MGLKGEGIGLDKVGLGVVGEEGHIDGGKAVVVVGLGRSGGVHGDAIGLVVNGLEVLFALFLARGAGLGAEIGVAAEVVVLVARHR